MCKIGSMACLFVETVARGRNGHNFSLAFRTGIPVALPVPLTARSKAARLLRSWVRIPPGDGYLL